MPKISLLIAVYNSSPWIHDCLDSLRRQTMTDFEAICVDDGSTDDSLRILRQYGQADSRFKVIALKQNGGQAKARNVALNVATGEMIGFLDSDDWLADDALEQVEKVVSAYPATDAVLLDCIYCYGSKGADGYREEKYDMPKFDVLTGREAFKLSLDWSIHGVYMVKRDIHKRFPYDDSAKTYSDDNTTRLHYLYSREVRRSRGRYYYRQHAESVTHAVSVRRFDEIIANESMKRQLLELHADESILDMYENIKWVNLIGIGYYLFRHWRNFSCQERRYAIGLIRQAWKNTDTGRLHHRHKPGYIPMHHCWMMFCMQEVAYFSTRMLLKR